MRFALQDLSSSRSIERSSWPSAPAAVALALLISLVSACEGENELVQGLDEAEANEILVVLDAKQVPAKKVKLDGRVITFSITVPESDARTALRVLVANKLPRRRPTGLAEVYPAGSGGLIPTR